VTVTDTSFLFSLFGSDGHTGDAEAWAKQSNQPITITALNRYEFGNAIRFAAFRKVIRQSEAQETLVAFEKDLKRGILQLVRCDLTAVVDEAEQLSELHTIANGHRSFDILHIATARVLKATMILTFDLNQRKLANTVGLPIGP
jgi:predicted nucleic acid-binding protein